MIRTASSTVLAAASLACVAPIPPHGHSDQLDVRAYDRLSPAKALAVALEDAPWPRLAFGWSSEQPDQEAANATALAECEAERRALAIAPSCRVILVGDDFDTRHPDAPRPPASGMGSEPGPGASPYSPDVIFAFRNSQLRRAMCSIEISLGHSAAQAPTLVQALKPSSSI